MSTLACDIETYVFYLHYYVVNVLPNEYFFRRLLHILTSRLHQFKI